MGGMLATPANMRKLANIRTPGAALFSYSPRTFERYSATPGDYWNVPDDDPLTDSNGEPMVLAFETTAVTVVESAEHPGWRDAEYEEALNVARGLVEPGERNAEYERGIVELLADMFGKPGVFLSDRKDEVARDLGWSNV